MKNEQMEADGMHGRWPLGTPKRIGHALALVLLFEILHVAAAGVMFGALGLDPTEMWSGQPVVIAIDGAIGLLAFLSVLWLGVIVLGRVSWRELGWHTERLDRSIGLGLAGFLALTAMLLLPLWALGFLADVDVLGVLTGYTAGQRLLFLVIGVCAATVEESLFRGYLQPALIAKLGLVGGIVVGAAVFSLYHLFQGPNPINLLMKLGFGLVLGALRGRNRSLLAPVLAHFLFWQIIGSL